MTLNGGGSTLDLCIMVSNILVLEYFHLTSGDAWRSKEEVSVRLFESFTLMSYKQT